MWFWKPLASGTWAGFCRTQRRRPRRKPPDSYSEPKALMYTMGRQSRRPFCVGAGAELPALAECDRITGCLGNLEGRVYGTGPVLAFVWCKVLM